jgi:orotate phosphoribosyltransferase
MLETELKTAGFLLESKAVILRPSDPFTWASGWRSPIYCDNRVTLSYPAIRDYIKESIRGMIREHFGIPDLIAGVATGAIAQGMLVADLMELPFVYVRASAKEHGRKNLVEGRMDKGKKVVVVEDLISTGGSSLKAVEALREAGGEVLGMVAVFTYGFRIAENAFRDAGVKLVTLSNYHTLVELALTSGYIGMEHKELLEEWRRDPASWTGKRSG